VTPLKDVTQVGGRGGLWMSVSMAELQMDSVWLGVAVDEVTGRAILCHSLGMGKTSAHNEDLRC